MAAFREFAYQLLSKGNSLQTSLSSNWSRVVCVGTYLILGLWIMTRSLWTSVLDGLWFELMVSFELTGLLLVRFLLIWFEATIGKEVASRAWIELPGDGDIEDRTACSFTWITPLFTWWSPLFAWLTETAVEFIQGMTFLVKLGRILLSVRHLQLHDQEWTATVLPPCDWKQNGGMENCIAVMWSHCILIRKKIKNSTRNKSYGIVIQNIK